MRRAESFTVHLRRLGPAITRRAVSAVSDSAVDLAARICARALPEILVSPVLIHLAGSVEGVAFQDRGGPLVKTIQIEFRSLGPLEALMGGRSIPLGGPRQRLVLAHLLLEANHVLGIDQLIDRIWGEDPPPAARNVIQSYVSHLRSLLGPDRLEGRFRGYVLHADPDEVDFQRFECLLGLARCEATTDPKRAVETFNEALSLWRGTPLSDLQSAPSLTGVISRLEELRLSALEERAALRLDLGENAQVIPELEVLVAGHPWRERLWGYLMLAQYRSGRQGDALDTFGRVRSVLAEDLGVDPSPELRGLHELVLKQHPSLG